jgi:hypothetical protein
MRFHLAPTNKGHDIMRKFNLETFIRAYVECALWSSHGPEEEPFACENLDDLFDIGDIAPETMASMREDCADFVKANIDDLLAYCEQMGNEQWSGEARAGHDFWLTRNGHGVGFWDRGLDDLGERLTKAAKVYGSIDLYPGDDGKVYG